MTSWVPCKCVRLRGSQNFTKEYESEHDLGFLEVSTSLNNKNSYTKKIIATFSYVKQSYLYEEDFRTLRRQGFKTCPEKETNMMI